MPKNVSGSLKSDPSYAPDLDEAMDFSHWDGGMDVPEDQVRVVSVDQVPPEMLAYATKVR